MAVKNVLKRIANKLGYSVMRTSTFESLNELLATRGRISDSHCLSAEPSSIEQTVKQVGPDIVFYMASTGVGTDECMDKGCLPVLAHFYQPIPDLKELERRKVWDKVSDLAGIEWSPSEYLQYLHELAEYANECDWPNEPPSDAAPLTFHINNTSFSYGCASALHSIIRKNKPKRVIEIGSGNSSKIIASALLAVSTHDTHYTIIDPYSSIDVRKYPKGTDLLKKPVEEVDVSVFLELQENDILFIDSSHVCKIGSDVNFEILEILPRLNKGVYVHFHDIDLPFEYSKAYATTPTFRMFWTESYLLQAFLSHNNKYKVILPMAYIQRNHADVFRNLYPKGNDATLWGSGSFWIKCVK